MNNEVLKMFVTLSSLVGIFISGLSFGLDHWYIGFGFLMWSTLALLVLTPAEKQRKHNVKEGNVIGR